MNRRPLFASAVLALITVGRVAAADDTTTSAPPAAPAANPWPATTTSTTSTTTAATVPAATSTTTTTSLDYSSQRPVDESTPPVPTHEKPCGLINKSCKGPHLEASIEGGAASFNESGPFGFSTGIGSASKFGGTWGIRVGASLTKWLALDAHYVGMNNRATGAGTPDGSVSLFTSGVTGEFRLTAPIPYVQPYIVGGAGVYTTSVTGGDVALRKSPLYGSTEFGIPMGVGLTIPISNGVSVGGEATYHRFFGEAFSDVEEIGGGDLTTFAGVVRAQF